MEYLIDLGNKTIRMHAPENFPEQEDRISFWWGLTTSSVKLAIKIMRQENLRGKSVLELGSGIGLTGIAALLQDATVTFSDYLPEALKTVANNIHCNGIVAQNASYMLLDWEDPGTVPCFDMILGTEIVYDYFYHSSLIQLMDKALAPGGHIVLADRKRLVVERFVGRLLSKGFICTEEISRCRVDGFPDQEITFFDITRSGSKRD